MDDREKGNGQNSQSARAVLWVIAAMAAVIFTLAFLHIAVQRERAATAAGQAELSLPSGVSVGASR
jgi:hypothetical protein